MTSNHSVKLMLVYDFTRVDDFSTSGSGDKVIDNQFLNLDRKVLIQKLHVKIGRNKLRALSVGSTLERCTVAVQ